MSSLNNYVDTSIKSLAIAGVVFIIALAVSKYMFDIYNADTKEEDKRSTYLTLLYCVLIGLIFALLTLVLCKQFYNFENSGILTDPFPK